MADDFYEQDEPVEDVIAAFERGTKVSMLPLRGRNVYLGPDGDEIDYGTTTA